MSRDTITLGPFELVREIGRGGMSRVWEGVHRRQEVPVAIKVLSPEHIDPLTAREALETEVRAVARLDHPGVVSVFDYGTVPPLAAAASGGQLEADSPYLVMELAPEGTLLGRGAMPWPDLRRALVELLDALAHAHARGVIHRDIKPGNVLVGSALPGRGGLKLTDFGLAHAMGGEGSQQVGGTLQYMAPEQFRGDWRDFGPWTDLYSFGCLAWELASGAPPYEGSTLGALRLAHTARPLPPLRPRHPVPEGLEGWLARLLLKHPADRFQRAADAAYALAQLGAPVELAGAPASYEPFDGATTLRSAITWTEEVTPPARLREPTPEPERPLPAIAPLPPMPRDWRYRRPPPPPLQLLGAGLGLFGLRAVRMVGRASLRDRIWRVLRAVRDDGRARVVVLTGPEGIGKSRLAGWMAQRAHELGAATLLRATYNADPEPDDGLGAMLSRHLRCGGLRGSALAQRVEWLILDMDRPDPGLWEGLVELMEGASSPHTFDALARYLEVSSQRVDGSFRPRVLWIDEVQWGGEALEFAAHLLRDRDRRRCPALLLLTARDEALAERPGEAAVLGALASTAGAAALSVPPLNPRERRALVEALLGLEGPLAARVAARTSGNPLFAVQLIGHWVQRGALEANRGGFGLREGEVEAMPDTLHRVWSRKVERLLQGQPQSAEVALELASALGPWVDVVEWRGACEQAGVSPPGELLEMLLQRRLIQVTEEGWAFTHGMLRECIERRARERGRARSNHLACAAALARLHPPGQLGLAERVGLHLSRAGAAAEALEPLLQAVQERADAYELDTARELAELRESLADAAGLPEEDEARGEGWLLLTRICNLQGDLETSLRYAHRLEAAARRNGWTRLLAGALRALSHELSPRGQRDEAEAAAREALALFEQLGDDARAASALNWLGFSAQKRGAVDEAERWSSLALARFEQLGDDSGRADAAWVLAHVALQRGELDLARGRFEAVEALYASLNQPLKRANVLNDLAEIRRHRGELVAAEDLYRRSLELQQQLGSGQAVIPRLNLGLTLLARGQAVAAGAELGMVRAELLRQGRLGYLPYALLGLLARDAVILSEADFDRHLEELLEAMDGSTVADKDLVWLAELAAGKAMAAGWGVRARGLLIAVRSQCVRDRYDEGAARLDALLFGEE
jgi:serine/threonine protein kinase